jgi:hypothetical protein
MSLRDTISCRDTGLGWIVRLMSTAEGWLLEVATKGREAEDLSRLTPPWHCAPNPRQIEGWHVRNVDNSAPNDGSVNAPQEFREFIFSPAVGREIEYKGQCDNERNCRESPGVRARVVLHRGVQPLSCAARRARGV